MPKSMYSKLNTLATTEETENKKIRSRVHSPACPGKINKLTFVKKITSYLVKCVSSCLHKNICNICYIYVYMYIYVHMYVYMHICIYYDVCIYVPT
jgi:hypothetical protein